MPLTLFVSVLRPGRDLSLARPTQERSQRKYNILSLYDALLTSCSTNLTVKKSPSFVTPEQLPQVPANETLPAAPIDPSIDKWFFISGAAA